MVAKPDPATFQVLPWEADDGKVYSARMFCDITMPDGSPSWADPRHVLRRVMGEAAAMGFTCYVHPEIEFFLLKDLPDDGSAPEPADSGGFFDQASHDVAPHFRRRAIETLESMGISVEFSHHEGAPGQQEIDLRYADALTMADNIMSFRYVVKEVALTQGVRASFMPKPFADHPGFGHAHALLAVRGGVERVPRSRTTNTRCRPPARRSWPGCCGTRRSSPRCAASTSTPTSAW